MKKLLIGAACAVMMLGAVSCGNSGPDKKAGVLSPEENDSLVDIHSSVFAYDVNNSIAKMIEGDSTFNKDEVLKGIQYILAADTTSAYSTGIQIGMSIASQFKQMRELGIVVDEAAWFDNFKKIFKSDSVKNQMEMQMLSQDVQKFAQKASEAKRQQTLAEIKNSAEAQGNLKQAKAHVASLKAKDSSIKDGEEGIAYKVENAGNGKIKDEDKVTLKVNVSALNGENPPSIPSNPFVVSALPKGIKAALKQLGKGGKGTFYIPQEAIYELDMAQRMGLAPCTLYTYEIEVVDVEAPEVPKADAAKTPVKAVNVPDKAKVK